MNTPLFIARRLERPHKPGVMVRIAVVAVAVSVAVMVVAVAVVGGFERELTSRLRAVVPDVEITAVEGPIQWSPELGGVPYTIKEGVVKTPDALVGVLLKGIPDSLRGKDVLLSTTVARELKVDAGDKIEMLFTSEGGLRRDRFKVAGLFATGLDEFDRGLALTRIENVQRLLGYTADEVSGVEIRLNDPSQADAEARRLNERFTGNEAWWGLSARTSRAQFPMIFDWLATHNVNAAVILTIMVIVALFNMATALLTLVLERTRMIGVLKTMGMTNASLQRLFVYRAVGIMGRGMLWGNVVGVGLCLLQSHFHLLRLNPEGYILSEVPIHLCVGAWTALNIGTAVVIFALLLIPASIVSRIKPDQAVKHS